MVKNTGKTPVQYIVPDFLECTHELKDHIINSSNNNRCKCVWVESLEV